MKDETTCIEPRGLTSELGLDAGDDLDGWHLGTMAPSSRIYQLSG